MKRKDLSKITLNKSIITKLNHSEKHQIKGGSNICPTFLCDTGGWLTIPSEKDCQNKM